MKVRKLKDRHGEVFTPLVHKDSVIDVNGVPLKSWISPIAINGVDAGYSSKTDIVDGTHITISNVRVADTDGSYHNQVKATHNNIKRTDIPATGNPSSGSTVDVISAMTSDPQGHVLTVTTKTVTFPLDATITPSDKVIYLTGTENKNGVNRLKSADSATYSPTTKRLKAPILEGNLADGSKGSIPYQTDADSTQYLGIGTTGQILSVSADGVPSWIDKVNGLLSQAWTNGTTQGPVPTFGLENGTGKTKTLTGVAVPSASASNSGVVTTTTQSFSGDKTFTGNVVVEKDLTVKGNLVTVNEKDIVVSDKLITLAASNNASEDTASGAGVCVATKYDGTATVIGDKYKGPTFIWNKTTGWTTGNSDSTARSSDINVVGGVLRFNGTQVLSSTQYTGNSASANKVNHTLSFASKTFNGSADVTIRLDDIGTSSSPLSVKFGGTGRTSLTKSAILVGNGADTMSLLSVGTSRQVVSASASGAPEYATLTLDYIPNVPFSLYEDSTLGDVTDFAV